MIGSMPLMDFKSKKKLHAQLNKEPYLIGKVWEKPEVQKCNVCDPWQFNRPQNRFEEREAKRSVTVWFLSNYQI